MTFHSQGDGNMRYYEILPETPYAQYLNTYVTSNPQRGMGCMPKRFLNHKDCEVMRLFKLHNKGLVEPIAMTVPRKVSNSLPLTGVRSSFTLGLKVLYNTSLLDTAASNLLHPNRVFFL